MNTFTILILIIQTAYTQTYEVFKKDKLEKETEYTNINQFINMYKFLIKQILMKFLN